MDKLILFAATGFGSGYLPVAPGTWGALVALPIQFMLLMLPVNYYWPALSIIFIIAVATAGSAEKIFDKKDPGAVVIDEIFGMLIALIGAPATPLAWGSAFLLFRLFDIWKPFPASWVDDHLNGGLGIVLDDVIAGGYALLCMQILSYYW
ncbi:MAG: phosphatidylglycerophosphatase A [Deltaproteobacteria bacterium]|nr:phosphatidylglycerophosphatase A [Deltaproteobacteria bacterium]